MSSKVSRRKFLIAGAGLVTATGIGYLTKDYWSSFTQNILSPRPTATPEYSPEEILLPENHLPIADFDYKPKFVNPTTEQTVEFTNISQDPDGDELYYTWSIGRLERYEIVDEEVVCNCENLSTELPKGENYAVRLRTSDGEFEDTKTVIFSVEPEQIYPLKDLNVNIKGVCYSPGFGYASYPNMSDSQMEEDIQVIRDELGCNGIRIFGDNDTSLIKCAEIALNNGGFENVTICPRYMNESIESTMSLIESFIQELSTLEYDNSVLVFQVGNELTIDASDLIPGRSYRERIDAGQWSGGPWKTKLSPFLQELVSICKVNFEGKLSYAAGDWEVNSVPWKIFDIIGINRYNPNITYLRNFANYREPVHITEFGSCTFEGACAYGGAGWMHTGQFPYSEEEQANCIENYLESFNKANIQGCFLFQLREPDKKSFCILNLKERKRSFYMYKSYQRVES